MNTIVNDKGQRVAAVGAEGSIARVRVQYPALIEAMSKVGYGSAKQMALQVTTSNLEIASLMVACGCIPIAKYNQEINTILQEMSCNQESPVV